MGAKAVAGNRDATALAVTGNRKVSMMARLWTSCLRLALPLALSLAAADVAAAQTKLDATYSATLLGIPIGHIAWTVELRDKSFDSSATGGLTGLLRVFTSGEAEVAARGSMSGAKPVPTNFTLKVVAGRWSDDVRIVFSGDKAKEYVPHAPPPDASSKLVPLTDANRIGVLDPMTALLVYVPGTGATPVPEACDRNVAVFDGHTRYNLRLGFKRLDTVKSDQGYEGRVVVCSAKFSPVAGYDPKHFLVTYLASQRDIEIWLAPIDGSRLLVPYRVSMPTPMGLGILQANKFVSLPAQSLGTNPR
jgi:hypothetical protein